MSRVWLNIGAFLLFSGVLLAGAFPASGQSLSGVVGEENVDERGLPFPSEHYAPPEYGQDPQNWAVVQDDRGLTYVANSDGLMQYDGERWRLIPTVTTPARSLAVDSLIFVGAKGDFGYLRSDSRRGLHYQSLTELIPEGERDFKDVWATHVLSDGVYFQANERLFRWDGSDITSWDSEEGFHTSFAVDGTLYVREFGRGLLQMKEDSLTLVPGGEAFSDAPIRMMASHPSGDLLIATEDMGLQLYDGRTLRPLASEVTSYLDENELYHGSRLPGDRYALATLGGGVLVVGANGQILRILDKSTGLPDEVVNYVHADQEGQLWMALNNEGVYRAGLNTSTTLHDERTGLDGRVRSMYYHNGAMHVATGSGLYVFRDGEGQSLEEENRFTKQRGLPLSWDLLSVGGDLLVSTNEGVYQIGEQGEQKLTEGQAYDLLKSEKENKVYVSTRSGVINLRRVENEWRSLSIKEVDEDIQSIALDPQGNIWANTEAGDILRMELSDDSSRVTSTMRFDESNGLPDIYKVPMTVDGRLTIRSKQGIFQVDNPNEDPENWQFSSRPSLLPQGVGADTLTVKSFLEDDDGTLWVALGNQVFKRQQMENDRYRWSSVEPLHFEKSERVGFHIEEDGTVWLSTGRDLIRYAPDPERGMSRSSLDFRALVRQVTTLRDDRVVYGGAPEGAGAVSMLTLPYAGNDIRIAVAAPFYGTTDSQQYQYKLAGQSQWSDWRQEAGITYTNLWEGTYRFQVRARNERGQVSQAGTLTFQVQPPWYRSGWAYLLYAIGIVLVGLAFRRYYRTKKEKEQTKEELRRYKDELEELVRERTRELEESEAKFRTLAENSLVGTLLIQDGRMQYVNEAFAQMYGYVPEELIGRKYIETVVHPDDRDRLRFHNGRCLHGEVENTEFQYRGMTKEGEVIHVKGFGSRIDYRGRPAIIGTEIDVTERIRLQREVLHVQEEERRRIGQDLHDGVASQLTGVSIMLDTMAHRKVEDGVADRLLEIRDLVVESCRDIRQLSRGLNPTGLSEGDLPAALRRLSENTDDCRFVARGFETDRDVPRPDDLPEMDEDAAAHLYCIAQEATANARQYAEAEEIAIRLERENDAIVLTIEDDGKGFDPSTIQEEGLGLRSMRYRADLLGADYTIESRPGEGTRVRCRLPA